jgi:Leucine-rich repeat (LRR) protein
LVRSFTANAEMVSRHSSIEVDGLTLGSYLDTTQVLLQSAMQLAASGTCSAVQQTVHLPGGSNVTSTSPSPAAAAAASAKNPQLPGVRLGQQHQQQQQRLRLASFSTDWLGTSATIAALPAHSLTRLDLTFPYTDVPKSEAMLAALAQLTSLRQLRMGPYGGRWSFPTTLLSAVPYMKQLTLLELSGNFDTDSRQWALQQLLLLPLPLQRLQIGSLSLPTLNFAALTQLSKLSIAADIYDNSQLPAQLQQLTANVSCWGRNLGAVTGLQQLQCISLRGCVYATALLQLAQLPALRHMALKYTRADHAFVAAGVWPQLPQLQELEVLYHDGAPKRQQWIAIRSAVAACTGLTKLTQQSVAYKLLEELVDGDGEVDAEVDGGMDDEHMGAVCGSLAGLTSLRDLCIQGLCISDEVPGDALALTALTGLTRLVLDEAYGAVNDSIATALACNLRQLQHLDLRRCNLGHMACLAAIAQLTQLTELRLEDNDLVTRQGLMLLTGLKQLQRLGVDTNAEVTAAVLEGFWSAVRQPRA